MVIAALFLARGSITGADDVLLLYSDEVFPTDIRSTVVVRLWKVRLVFNATVRAGASTAVVQRIGVPLGWIRHPARRTSPVHS